jgi:glyoxylase-like metal-dependent hydrolase (beta-lactamase superfamily II)
MSSAALESALTFPLSEQLPTAGKTLEVAPGILWVRMGLPFALDHINLWLVRDALEGPEGLRQGWTAIDCGIHNDATHRDWEQVFAGAMEGLPVLRVLVTHMHPDHMGSADWMCAKWKAPLWMSSSEYQSAQMAANGLSNFGGDLTHSFFAQHGWSDPDAVRDVKARQNYYSGMVPQVPNRYHRLMGGQTFKMGDAAWRCIAGYGHSPEHMALYCADQHILISGDMVLPKISTNVSVYAQEPEGNALQQFLDSLDAFQDLPEETLVLPSHGRPFKGLHTRIGQLQDHHKERLADVLGACKEKPQTAHDTLPILFKRELNFHQTTFAMGEAVAHLHVLWQNGQVKRTLDPDGIYRFAAL